jgi:AcrR family transcriptional regulator
MARHKSISDDDVLDRLMPAILAHGPDGLTLALAGSAAGLSAATLLQRFRSREGLIEAILLRAWDRLDMETAKAIASAAPGAEGALALLQALLPKEKEESHMTDGLLLLREDFRNAALRQRGEAWGKVLATALETHLSPGRETGGRLGWQMLQIWQGALIWWAFSRTGTAEAYVMAALQDWCDTAGLLPGRRPH